MTTDGGLGKEFKHNIPVAHWQSVETWSTGQGVPDLNYCINGREGWIELKATSGWKVNISPEQVAWIERRMRNGGCVTIAVRRKSEAGPRKGKATDELWLFPPREIRKLAKGPINALGVDNYAIYHGGPASWNWLDIQGILRR